jgi:hypothetical protein
MKIRPTPRTRHPEQPSRMVSAAEGSLEQVDTSNAGIVHTALLGSDAIASEQV